MKRNLLFLVIVLFAFSAVAQNVPRENVVVEIATGTWCPYCPGSAMGGDDLIANGHDVAVIEYHNGDEYANVYSNYRNSYYGVTGYPTAHFDGLNAYVGGSATQTLYGPYLSRVNQRLAVTSSYTISASGTNAGMIDFNFDIEINKVGTHTGNNLVLHTVVTESHIEEYWQGMSELNFVARLMAPNQYGTALNFSSGNTQVVNVQFSLDPEWVVEECEVVFFIQQTTNKEIHQAIKMDLMNVPSEFDHDAAVTEINNIPQTTCSGSMVPAVTIRNNGNATLSSLDIKYHMNNGDPITQAWTGALEYLQEEQVELNELSFSVLDENELMVYTDNPNGQGDQYPDNDTAFNIIMKGQYTPSTVNLIMRTDENPGETTWELTNSAGAVLYAGGPYTSSGQMIMEEFELNEVDCYAFTIYDSGNDGLKAPGFYMIYHGDNNVVAQGVGFGAQESNEFTADDAVGIDDLSGTSASMEVYPNPFSGETTLRLTLLRTEQVQVEVYSMTGEKVISLDQGVLNAGMHHIRINLEGRSSGLYVARITAGKEVINQKITLR